MSERGEKFGEQHQAEFGYYLRELRRHRGLKQKQVASDLGIKPETLCAIEKGKRSAPDEQLACLAQKYGVPLEEILRRKYWPQLRLLTGIMTPAELMEDLTKRLLPDEQEEVTRYAAFLLLKRPRANQRGNSGRNRPAS